MNSGNATFVVLGGPGFAIMDKIYEAMPPILKNRFKGKKIRYPGTPFGHRSPPFLWAPEEQRIVPLARLHYYWGDIAQYNADKLEKDLKEADLVLGLRYGFCGYCGATADCSSTRTKSGLHQQHHTNVGITLPVQNIVRPFYVLLKGTRPQLINALARRYRKLDEKVLGKYVDHYLDSICEYFEGTGQNVPLYLDLSMSFDEMQNDLAEKLSTLFELYK